MTRRVLAMAAALLALQGSAHGICTAKPSVREEVRASDAVVLAKVRAQRLVVAADDPEGFEATVYTLDILRHFKGNESKTPHSVDIESPNTSSRFSMAQGKTYLLFLTQDPSGYAVDACGNSARLNRRLQEQVRAAIRRKAHQGGGR